MTVAYVFRVLSFVTLTLFGLTSTPAFSEELFQGKTVRIVVGYPPGGGYDVYARLIAQFLPNFLPGRPTVIVQNMPGAGSITASNFVYSVAERDGTVIGAVSSSAPFAPLQGVKGATFDAAKFNWVGSPNTEIGLLIVWHGSPIKTIEDARQHELLVASSSANSNTSFFARVLRETLGLKLKIIVGYPGSTESFLAMERGEVDGYPSAFLSSLRATKPDWLKNGDINILVQYGAAPSPDLPNVPFARDLALDDDARALMDAAGSPLAFGRPFMLPPNVSPAVLTAVRSAFEATFAASDFQHEAQRQNYKLNPITGGEMQNILVRAYGAPAKIIAKQRELLEEQRR